MRTAPHPVEPTSSPHQGVGARFFRRLGGAVRDALAGGIARATGRRRSITARPSRNPPAPEAQAAPSPRRSRAPHPRRAAAPALPARPGWIARCFGLADRLPWLLRRATSPDDDTAPFTPETHPGFSPEVCDFLNTPVAECDPNELYLALCVLAQCLAESLPPELGMDAKALFSTLWDRLGPPQAEAGPDTPADAPHPPAAAAPEPAELDAQAPSPQSQAQGSEPADGTPATAAPRTTPARVSLAGSGFRGSRSPSDGGPSFRRRRSPVERRRPRLRRAPLQALPLRRLCYAACAGPP